MSRWTTFFNAVMALATLAIALVAVWGFFFTDIPEQLVRQFRADIADTREQLTDLRMERRNLRDELQQTQLDLEELKREQNRAREELERLETEKHQVEGELSAIRNERRQYLQNMLRLETQKTFSGISGKISSYQKSLALLKEYPEVVEWIEKGERLGLDKGPSRGMRQLYDQWRDEAPRLWSIERAMYRLRRRAKDEPLPSEREILEHYKIDFTANSSRPAPTVNSLLSEAIEGDAFMLLLPQDRERVLSTIRQYMSQNQEVLSQPLLPALPSGWTKDDVPAAVAALESAQSQAQIHLRKLRRMVQPKK